MFGVTTAQLLSHIFCTKSFTAGSCCTVPRMLNPSLEKEVSDCTTKGLSCLVICKSELTGLDKVRFFSLQCKVITVFNR
jgi:hypothetical protein